MKLKTIEISDEVAGILRLCTAAGDKLILPNAHIPRPVYEAVAKTVNAMGGTWDRRAKAMVFRQGTNVAEILAEHLVAGEVVDQKKTYQVFETPDAIADMVVQLAGISSEHLLLEPSAGSGALLKACQRISRPMHSTAIDIRPETEEDLRKVAHAVQIGDFIQLAGGMRQMFDRIIMNPPFTGQQDIDHVVSAMLCLRSPGVLVAVMPPSGFTAQNGKGEVFRSMFDRFKGEQWDCPPGSFKEAGTMVNTKIVRMTKKAR